MPRISKNYETQEICELFSFHTFDEIPIRKIMVANITSRTTHKDLKNEFKSYGEIIDCNLKRKSSFKNSYAFITFKDSKSAHRAMRDKNIRIDGYYLRVWPAAAWNQPDRNKYTNIPIKLVDIEENRLSAYCHYSSNDECTISKLNEYCLLHIFGFLPIRDIIRMQRVCRYWQIISEESLHLHKKLDCLFDSHNFGYFDDAPTLYKTLEKYGSYITTVKNLNEHNCIQNSTLIAIAKLCPNIEEINLSNFPFLASGIKALAKNCTNIKRITIGMSTHVGYKNIKYDKELSALFSKNRKLQYLHFIGDIINGSCLKHLSTKDIIQISLTRQNCALFIRIISKIQNLFTLIIRCSCSNVDMLFQDQGLKLNAENIEKLTITGTGVIEIKVHNLGILRAIKECTINNFFKSTNLKNLKYLNLSHYPLYIADDFLLTLGEKFNQQLTYVDITGAKGLTNSGLICIITSLSKLEHFHMADMYETVTDEIFCCGMPNLKTLNCSFCSGIQDEGLIKFINNSDKLEKLNVHNCPLITDKLIFAAIEYTKQRKNEIVLSIYALNTKVNVKIEKEKENSPVVEFRYIKFGNTTPSFWWLQNGDAKINNCAVAYKHTINRIYYS